MKKFFKVVGVVLLSFVGLAVVAWLGLVAYFNLRAGDITPSDDSDLRIVEEKLPDAENGYVAFLAITNLYVLSSDDATVCTEYRTWRRSGSLSRHQEARTNDWQVTVDRVLADHAPYFAGLHKAVACPRYGFVNDGGTWGGLVAMPPVTAMMRANWLWTTKAMRETERGDYAAALETVRDHFAFGQKVSANPSTLVELLIGLGIRGCAEDDAAALSACEDVPDVILADLATIVRDEPDTAAAFARAVRCEYGNGVDKLCEMIRDKSWSETVMAFVGELFGSVSAKRGRAMAERCFAWLPGFLRFSIQPGATKQAYADAVRAMLKGEDAEKAVPKPRTPFEPNWAGRTMVRTMTASIHSQHKCFKSRVLHTRFAQLVVAAQRYRRTHGGAYPPSLDALVPAFLDAVPHDPFAPDSELRYDAAKYLAWAVGEDGDFNPFPEKPPHSFYRFDRDRDKYAARLDGKPHERRQNVRWTKKAK